MGYKREDWLANNKQQPSNHVRTTPKSNEKAFTDAVTYSPPIAKTTRKNLAHTKAKPVVNKSHEESLRIRSATGAWRPWLSISLGRPNSLVR